MQISTAAEQMVTNREGVFPTSRHLAQGLAIELSTSTNPIHEEGMLPGLARLATECHPDSRSPTDHGQGRQGSGNGRTRPKTDALTGARSSSCCAGRPAHLLTDLPPQNHAASGGAAQTSTKLLQALVRSAHRVLNTDTELLGDIAIIQALTKTHADHLTLAFGKLLHRTFDGVEHTGEYITVVFRGRLFGGRLGQAPLTALPTDLSAVVVDSGVIGHPADPAEKMILIDEFPANQTTSDGRHTGLDGVVETASRWQAASTDMTDPGRDITQQFVPGGIVVVTTEHALDRCPCSLIAFQGAIDRGVAVMHGCHDTPAQLNPQQARSQPCYHFVRRQPQ